MNRKLLRDLSRLRGQVVSIALVVAAGIACYVGLVGTSRSLHTARDTYYERERFADVFARIEEAPEDVRLRLAALPGVAIAATRIVERIRLPIDHEAQPPIGVAVSIPDEGPPPLNGVRLVRGKLPEGDEALLIARFADERGIEPGDTLPVILERQLRDVRISGIAISPEYVYSIAPGSNVTPDDERFAVLWMRRSSLEAATQMTGSFNEAVFSLQPGASEAAVIDAVERVLEPYGGKGAVGRRDQASNAVLNSEFEQIDRLARFIPAIFLAVAAFLLNVVLGRLVLLQRGEIAALKAIGYFDRQIAVHYLVLASIVVLLGAALGTVAGVVMGDWLVDVDDEYFEFPNATFILDLWLVVTALLVSLLAGVVSALSSLASIVRLPPAEAMRPPAPANYRPTLLDRLGLGRALGPASRMVLRELERKPVRALLSATGIGLAIAIVILGRFSVDTVELFLDRELRQAAREDLSAELSHAVAHASLLELASIPGVKHVEGLRRVPVRLVVGTRRRETTIVGWGPVRELRGVVGPDGEAIVVPEQGIMLTRILATELGVGVGDLVRVEVREDRRRAFDVPVTALSDELLGAQGHMALRELSRFLHEDVRYTSVAMTIDSARDREVVAALEDRPVVIGITRRVEQIATLEEQLASTVVFMTLVMTLFGVTIAVGVIYNNARVALSMRARDLGTLRVIGFTRREIASILVGELGVQLLLGSPLGVLFGYGFAAMLAESSMPERIRLPLHIASRTIALGITVAVVAWIAGAILVRRRLDRLDLIAVLKERE